MNKSILPILGIMLLIGALIAVPDPFTLNDEPDFFRDLVPDSLVTYPPVRMWELDNGLKILFWENHTSPVVSMRIGVQNTGSQYEGKFEGAGISHNLEHIVSGGSTGRMTETEYKEYLSGIGANVNAYTSRTITCYYINGPSPHFEEELQCLADWVSDCAFDTFELKREKGVITQEINKNQEEPSRIISDLFYKTIFKVHTAKYPIIGYINNFLDISREDLIEFYTANYSPDNCILAIAGDLTMEQVQNAVDESFADWKRQTHRSFSPQAEPNQTNARYSEATASVQTSSMRIGWPGKKRGTPDAYALDVLTDILTDGRTSRLYNKLVLEEQLCSGISASHYNPPWTPPTFMINVSDFDYQDRDKILRAIWDEIQLIKDEGVEEEEIEKQKTLLVKALMYENETVEGQTSSMMYTYIYSGRPYYLDFLVPQYMAVEAEDVQEVATKYLLPEKLNVALIHPPMEKKDDIIVKNTSGIDFKKHTLDNGLVVLVAENYNVPHIDIDMFFNAGLRYDPKDKTGLSNLTALYMMEGVKGFPTNEELNQYIESNGFNVETGGGNNTISVEGTFLPMDIENGMELLAKLAYEPTFPKSSLERLKQQLSMQIQAQRNNWSSEAYYQYRDIFFGDHPYSGNPTGDIEQLNSITRDDVIDFHNKYIAPNNCALAIAGPMPEDELLSLVEENFSNEKPVDAVYQKIALPEYKDSSEIHIEETPRGQITLVVGFKAPELGNHDRYSMAVMDGILSGTRGRLHEELRGVRDLVYVVWGSSFIGPEGGTYYVMTQTSPENFDTVNAVIHHEIERMKKGDFTQTEIDRSKTIIRESFNRRNQKQENHVFSAALDELYGLGYDYDDKYLEEIELIDKQNIIDYCRDYFVNPLTVIIAPEGFSTDLSAN